MNTDEVATAFRVSRNTIINWTDREGDPLPCREEPRGFHTFRDYKWDEVAQWAERNNVPIYSDK